MLGGDENLARVGAAPRAANLPEDDARRDPPLHRSKGGLDTLAVAVAERRDRRVRRGGVRRRRRVHRLPRPQGTIPTFSFSTLMNGEVDPRELRGKIVVVGATAPTLQDLHRRRPATS